MEFPPEIPTPPAPDVKLMQSYPNPAARKATISYQTARAGKVSLAVYNMLGQKVKVLVEQPQPAGSYKVQWDGRNQQGHGVSSGVYIYELKTEETNITKKLVLTR
jgi:flagellar hook assembly protein FlgD